MPLAFLMPLIRAALAEDIGTGDVTSELLIPVDMQTRMAFVAREPMVMCGIEVPQLVYAELDKKVQITNHVEEGAKIAAGTIIATVSGPAHAILTGERTALNIMQRMSGVATLTRRYVDAVEGTKAKILDTRKTMPGMRLADKYAVRVGGGMNHRMGLYDAVLVKDNHIAGIGDRESGIREMIENTRSRLATLLPHASCPKPILVECDALEQLSAALEAKPDRIMLDNMPPEMLREAVRITAGRVPLEATGGVNLGNIRAVAETGVDFISVGAITHSAPAVDIGLDYIPA